MKLIINKDYAHRHLFVTILMLGLGLWFGYDGVVTYPGMTAPELYRSIEKAEPPTEWTANKLEAFKLQKTRTQYGFSVLCLLAGLTIGIRLFSSAKFDFSFDGDSFTYNGKSYRRSDIASVDRTKWSTKTILILKLADGQRIILDAWHHIGVKEFESSL